MTPRTPPEEPRPLRLFVAVDVPSRVSGAVDAAAARWRERLPGGRWVAAENRHITLKFLGRTEPQLVDEVVRACRDAASGFRPFRLGVDGLGVFPGPSRARVLWVGLKDRQGSLKSLAGRLDEGLGGRFPAEKRPFSAHLTVARFNPPVPVKGLADELKATEVAAEPFEVRSLVLYRSHLSPKGARYETLDRFGFRG